MERYFHPPLEPVKEAVEAITTAYSELDSCHTGKSCLMASGKRAYVGAVACPRKWKLGTQIEIDGKVYTCEDRTAKRYDGRIDIFQGYKQEAYDKAIKYGIQKKLIYLIK